MTDDEVIQVLAEREGWTMAKKEIHFMDGPNGEHATWPRNLPQYITSKDALQPVLEKLSPEEWTALGTNLQSAYPSLIDSRGDLQFLLTIPAKDLAHAIAEAIKECAK